MFRHRLGTRTPAESRKRTSVCGSFWHQIIVILRITLGLGKKAGIRLIVAGTAGECAVSD